MSPPITLPARAILAIGRSGGGSRRKSLRTLLGYHIAEGEAITAAELPAEVETQSGTLYVTMTDAGPTLASTPREAFGLVQDPETTAADELQDEAPQAQQEAAEAMATRMRRAGCWSR